MDISIRPAVIGDLRAIQGLNLQLFEKEKEDYDSLLNLDWTFGKSGTEYFTNRISGDGGCVLVALSGNEMVGYLCGGIIKATECRNVPVVAKLENFFVSEPFRANGIGGRLYERFFKWCESKGTIKIRAGVYAGNEAAIRFYEANGFERLSSILESGVRQALLLND